MKMIKMEKGNITYHRAPQRIRVATLKNTRYFILAIGLLSLIFLVLVFPSPEGYTSLWLNRYPKKAPINSTINISFFIENHFDEDKTHAYAIFQDNELRVSGYVKTPKHSIIVINESIHFEYTEKSNSLIKIVLDGEKSVDFNVMVWRPKPRFYIETPFDRSEFKEYKGADRKFLDAGLILFVLYNKTSFRKEAVLHDTTPLYGFIDTETFTVDYMRGSHMLKDKFDVNQPVLLWSDGFENDTLGQDPVGWTIYDNGDLNDDVSVSGLKAKTGSKSVRIHENATSNFVYLFRQFGNSERGGVEFWILLNQTNSPFYCLVEELWSANIIILFDEDGGVYYRDGGIWGVLNSSYESNKWYGFKILWDSSSYTYDIYVNYGNRWIHKVKDRKYSSSSLPINTVMFRGKAVNNSGTMFVDDVQVERLPKLIITDSPQRAKTLMRRKLLFRLNH